MTDVERCGVCRCQRSGMRDGHNVQCSATAAVPISAAPSMSSVSSTFLPYVTPIHKLHIQMGVG